MRTEQVAGRVRDKLCGDYGTAFGPDHRGRYRIAWDRSTPHEHEVWVAVPSKFFEWAEAEQSDGDGC